MLDIINYGGTALQILTFPLAILAFYLYPKVDKTLKLLLPYFMLSASFELLSMLFIQGDNNLMLYHAFTFLEFIILIQFFKWIFHESNVAINLNFVLYPVGVFFILNTLLFQNIKTFNTNSSILASIIILISCFYAFFKFLDIENIEYLKAKKWLISAFFIYHITMIVFNLFSNIMMGMDQEHQFIIWILRMIVIGITRVIFIGSLIYLVVQTAKTRQLV